VLLKLAQWKLHFTEGRKSPSFAHLDQIQLRRFAHAGAEHLRVS
jgi:hypothetical protein